MTVSVIVFLFFCLFLDLFCFLAFGGWNPLLGNWPVFKGTVSILPYDDPWKVLILVLGLAGIARILIGKITPGLITMMFQKEEAAALESEAENEIE